VTDRQTDHATRSVTIGRIYVRSTVMQPNTTTTTTVLQPFFRDHPGEPEKLLDFIVHGKINRGRHTDHLVGCHSIRTNQCPPPPSLIFLHAGCPSCRPTNSVKALMQPNNTIIYYSTRKTTVTSSSWNLRSEIVNVANTDQVCFK